MELSFEYYSFLKENRSAPETVIFAFALGVPLLMIIAGVLSNLYKNTRNGKKINILVYATLITMWIVGMVTSLIFFLIEKNIVKLFLIALVVVLIVPVFILTNHKLIFKIYESVILPKVQDVYLKNNNVN